MEEAESANPTEEHDVAPMGSPPVVVVESPSGSESLAYSTKIGNGIRWMIFIPLMMVAFVAALEHLRGGGMRLPFWIIISVQAVVMAAVFGQPVTVAMKHWRRDRERLESGETACASDREAAVIAALVQLGGLVCHSWRVGRTPPHAPGAFQRMLEEAGAPTNVVIVQRALRVSVDSIPISPEFVEPERLLLGTMHRRSKAFFFQAAMLVFFIWVSVNSALAGDMITLAFILLGLIGFAIQLLKSYGVHIEEAKSPVMGMGVLSDHRGRRWSVVDSCVYLYPHRLGFDPLVMAELLGPQGHFTLIFHGPEDPALRMFWQRWMHPHPRPDLV